MFSDKITQSLAEAAKKCMAEALKGNQKKLDVDKDGKIEGEDLAKLRNMKKEEVEQISEKKYEPEDYNPAAAAARKKREAHAEARRQKAEDESLGGDKPTVRKIAGKAYGGAAQKDDVNEEVESLEEKEGYSAKEARAGKDIGKPGKNFSKIASGAAKRYGSEEAGKRVAGAVLAKLRKEGTTSFSDLIESYTEGGMKALFSKIEEEVDNETFTKEFKDQKDKFDGKKKGGDVAAPASQGVVNVKEETHTEIQVVDLTDGSQKPEITTIDLEEKTLTAGETAEKERIVKGMKKNLSGFKQRYGERAKSVMYATATKSAMKEEKVDHWENGYNHVREPISDEPYLDNARIRFNELKKQNPHKKGTPEHGEWHSGAHAAYEEHRDILKGH